MTQQRKYGKSLSDEIQEMIDDLDRMHEKFRQDLRREARKVFFIIWMLAAVVGTLVSCLVEWMIA